MNNNEVFVLKNYEGYFTGDVSFNNKLHKYVAGVTTNKLKARKFSSREDITGKAAYLFNKCKEQFYVNVLTITELEELKKKALEEAQKNYTELVEEQKKKLHAANALKKSQEQ